MEAAGALADVPVLVAAADSRGDRPSAVLDSALDRVPAELQAGVRGDCRAVRGRPALVVEARLELRLLVL